MRWHYCDPPLLWLFPIGYVLHVIEEHALGFSDWSAEAAGYTVSPEALLVYNAIGLLTFVRAFYQAPRRMLVGGIAAGAPTQLAVWIVIMTG